jgi:hypothetical protein
MRYMDEWTTLTLWTHQEIRKLSRSIVCPYHTQHPNKITAQHHNLMFRVPIVPVSMTRMYVYEDTMYMHTVIKYRITHFLEVYISFI